MIYDSIRPLSRALFCYYLLLQTLFWSCLFDGRPFYRPYSQRCTAKWSSAVNYAETSVPPRPIIKAYLFPRIITIIILTILYLLLAILHFVLLKNCKLLCAQLMFTTLVKVALVLLLLTLLSMTKVEGWNATGLVSLTLITIVIIKLFSIAIACTDLVDMSGDWSYLIEFGFGVILIAIVVLIELLVIMRILTAVAIVAAVFGTFLSSISLMDLHQNISINSWWWEEKLINGCMYHVFRQYTLLWCLRIEEKPRCVITIFDSTPQEQEPDVTVLNS